MDIAYFFNHYLPPDYWALYIAFGSVATFAWKSRWAFYTRRQRNKLIMRRCAEKLNATIEADVTLSMMWDCQYLPVNFQMSINEMTDAYKRYLNSLPLQTRHEIVDKLLDNQKVKAERRGEPTHDMVELLGHLSPVEVETMFYTINDNEIDWADLMRIGYHANQLANDVIAFRFRSPY